MANLVKKYTCPYYGTELWYSIDNNKPESVYKRHREDGPAVIYSGKKYNNYSWFLEGVAYSFNDWLDQLNISDQEKLILRIKYG